MRWSHPSASVSAIWTMWDALGHCGYPWFPPLEDPDPVLQSASPAALWVKWSPLDTSSGTWHPYVGKLIEALVSFFCTLPHTLHGCYLKQQNNPSFPRFKKDPIFKKACCKCTKLESKLNCWTVVSENKAPFYHWQASRSAACAIQLQTSGVQARRFFFFFFYKLQTFSASCGSWLTFMCFSFLG